MEEARCGAILDEAIEELLTEVVKKEVKLQDQRIRRDQKRKVDVERLPDAPGESCAGCSLGFRALERCRPHDWSPRGLRVNPPARGSPWRHCHCALGTPVHVLPSPGRTRPLPRTLPEPPGPGPQPTLTPSLSAPPSSCSFS